MNFQSLRIETPRLLITEFTPAFAESVHLLSLDGDNRRFMADEVFETVEDAAKKIEFLITRYEGDEGPFVYPVLLRGGVEAIHIGHVEAVSFADGWEIGYHIGQPYTGRGYASEAVAAFLPVIMKRLDITKIYGSAAIENIASLRVLEKVGFKRNYKEVNIYQGKKHTVMRYIYRVG